MQRSEAVLLTLILALAAGLIYGRLTTGHDWGDDFAGYIGQAKSIAEGNVHSYLEQNEITIHNSNTARRQIGPVAYPWGYPLLLAIIYPACGLDIFCLKLLNIPIYLLFLLVLYFLLKRHLTTTESLLIVGLFAVNPSFLTYQDFVLSDIPFMLFSTLAVWLAECALQDERAKNSPVFQAGLGVALFFAFSVRTVGILIVAAFFAVQSLQITMHYWKTGKFYVTYQTLIPYLVFGVLILVSNVLLPERIGAYISELRITRKDILYNLWYYQSRAFHFFSTLPAFLQLSWALVGLALIGMVLTFPRSPIFVLYMLATLGLYVVWPFPSTRFLFGIAPFTVYFAYYPIRYGLSRLPGIHATGRTTLLAALLLTLGVHFVWHAATIVRDNLLKDRAFPDGPFTPQSAELFSYIREQTPPDGGIIFFKPRLLTLLTGRIAWVFNDCESLNGIDSVASIKDERFSSPNAEALETCNPEMNPEIVFENGLFIVYKGKY